MTNSTRNGRVLVAPSAFGGTLTAGEAAAAMAAGVLDAGERTRTTMTPSLLPVSDGGPGLVSLAVSAGFDPQLRTVSGPLGQRLEAAYAVGTLNGKRTAVVELAQASGLHLLGRPPGPDTAMLATTKGTGDLLLAALDEGVRIEAGFFNELVQTTESKALRHAFFGERAASKIAPTSPRPAAESTASHSACAATSQSECPAQPSTPSQSRPATQHGTPGRTGCTSVPTPTLTPDHPGPP